MLCRLLRIRGTADKGQTSSNNHKQQARNNNQTPQGNEGQQNYMHGRVNHVTTETAQEAPDVVIGMFFVNSKPASVLFDFGASHSWYGLVSWM